MAVKKMLKKALGVGMIAGTLCMATAGGVMADWSTEPFYFDLEFNTETPYQYSDEQYKHNDSSSYVKYSSGRYNFVACIVGYDGSIREDIRLPEKTIYPGEGVYLTNWIYENGIPYAKLKGETNFDDDYVVEGNWSCDTY